MQINNQYLQDLYAQVEKRNAGEKEILQAVGEVFDPNTQEAVMQMPKEEGEVEGTVKQVFLKGYKQGDKVIRYAQVVVIG